MPNASHDEKGSLNEFTGINFNIKNIKDASTKKSLGPATRYGLGRSGDRIPEERISAPVHTPALGPTQPPIPMFLKLWSADHKWSSGSALVVLFRLNISPKKTEKIKLT
jgi:hypothetical protein